MCRPTSTHVISVLKGRGDVCGGSDEHGVPITIKARKEGVTPQDIVNRYHKIIKDSFEELGISFDVYGRTTSATHSRAASDFFRTLYDKGEFVEKTSMQLYDEEVGEFLADRYVTGRPAPTAARMAPMATSARLAAHRSAPPTLSTPSQPFQAVCLS